MNYRSFEKVFKQFGIVSVSQVRATRLVFDKNNFGRWEKQGLLIKLRNGYYAFADIAGTQCFAHYAAGKIYKPSYISLRTALAFHGIIPETINEITSVSSLKTSTYENNLGTFSYKKIKPSLMFGYNAIEKNGFTFFMASPEKAILDLLYLEPSYSLEKEIRNMHLDWKKLTTFAKMFEKRIILEKIALLKKIFLEDI
jgi:predicted transcriptional regulator of viral defense system